MSQRPDPNDPTGKKKILAPHIAIATRETEGGPIINKKDEKQISGYLMKLTDRSYVFQDKTIPTIAFHLVDGDEEFKVEMSLNTNMARGIMNRIIGCHNPGWIVFRVYLKKGKDGKDDTADTYLSSDDQPMNWAFDYKPNEKNAASHDPTIPYLETLVTEAPDPQDPKKTQKIYHKLNDFLLKHWRFHNELVQINFKKILAENKNLTRDGKPTVTATAQTQKPVDGEVTVDEFQPPIGDEPVIDNGVDDLPF